MALQGCWGGGLAVEAVVRGWGSAPAAWPGVDTGAGRARSESAAAACAGMDRFDLACLLWSCGRDEAAVRADVWAVLMLEGVKVQEVSPPRPWPKGALSGLVRGVIEEMRPHDPREPWTDARRRAATGLKMSKAAWSQTWGARYRAILDAGERRVGMARSRLADGR